MLRLPPIATRTDTLFPYTTLFRSGPPSLACLPNGRWMQDHVRHDEWLPCASFGVSLNSTRTPPISLGCTKMTGVPCAPMRGSPSTLAPFAFLTAFEDRISGTTNQNDRKTPGWGQTLRVGVEYVS